MFLKINFHQQNFNKNLCPIYYCCCLIKKKRIKKTKANKLFTKMAVEKFRYKISSIF